MSKKQRKNDIFNPSFSIKQFKITRKIVFIVIIFLSMFCYGASEFIYGNVTDIEIRTVRNIKIELISFSVNSSDEFFSNYKLINKSPYSIRLVINYPDKNNLYFETNYNDEKIKQSGIYWIWFKCINNSTKKYILEIKIDGVRI